MRYDPNQVKIRAEYVACTVGLLILLSYYFLFATFPFIVFPFAQYTYYRLFLVFCD